ncbi:MAG: ATP-binding cassette domain-containing protein [Cytophagales bacterium]|nr:MAG: ATP-binding cassette domain-containing protein [Cytophagales bacterium]TAF59651.1 MAG: ATP-binding cassette domain-containing protein [Cytophagales bacterium]
MSEEILKALTQLFAIISKQDGGATQGERDYVIRFFTQELDTKTVAEYVALYDKYAQFGVEASEGSEEEGEGSEAKKKKSDKDKGLTSVSDSVKVLRICKQINKTLTQKQKVIVLFKLLEMLAAENDFTRQRMEIIDTAARSFKISRDEYKLIESFATQPTSHTILDSEDILVFDDEQPPADSKKRYIDSGLLDGEIIFIHIKSVDLYFTKYTGHDEIFLNGQLVKTNSILLYSHGSVFKTPKGAPLYYSDLVTKFTVTEDNYKISLQVTNLEFRFPNGAVGLRNVNISEGPGKLIGIMGASGAGKTTLLNVLAGLEKPYKGDVKINGVDIHNDKKNIEGVIGYIAQDDILIEELTVFQNLYYNAKLCFKDLSEADLTKRVNDVLNSLGLDRIANLKVGNVLNKLISGGQRKRLNIALELIREPAVMFVDEPTSGLSSRDSENVIDLLKELSLKGKLIFVVIHQPSSDIYKMFDKMIILDTGGYPAFVGNPIEAVTYFKKATNQVGSDKGQCASCGNVTPELIFNLIEAKVVDEYGEFTNKRKITPAEWHELYKQKVTIEQVEEIKELPPKNLSIPSRIKQLVIFTVRDFLSKASNTQYMLINLLEAPFLALVLSLVVRYRNTSETADYVYRYNENIPAFVLICVIIALFMGLTVSAEEIIRDRKIQRREAFLNLSRISYICSKLLILFTLSAVQTLTFVLIGNFVLEIRELHLTYWLVLFSTSCFANVLGLNISASFNSAVTVYIIIPLILIPQMIMSGGIFRFDQLNNAITETGKVPILADFMVSRWAYEAIAVEQFKDNPYEDKFYATERVKSYSKFKMDDWIPEMKQIIEKAVVYKKNPSDSAKVALARDLALISNELQLIQSEKFAKELPKIDAAKLLTAVNFNEKTAEQLNQYLDKVNEAYNMVFLEADSREEAIRYKLEAAKKGELTEKQLKNLYFNERLSEMVKNVFINREDYAVSNGERVVQQIDPIYTAPNLFKHALDYRAHFYAPEKHFFGSFYGTLGFNVAAIWFLTAVLCITLYYESLAKLIALLSKINFGKLNFRKKK